MLTTLFRLGIIWSKEQDPILFHPERCTHARHQASTCTRCIESCPHGAITLAGRGVEISPACRDCGLCVSSCPVDALERRERGLEQYYSRLEESSKGKKELLFVCSRAKKGGGGFPLQCLGELEEVAIHVAMGEGVSEFLFLGGTCEGCPWRKGGERLKERTKAWEKKYPKCRFVWIEDAERKNEGGKGGEFGREKKGHDRQSEVERMDRRTFFKRMAAGTKDLVLKSIAPEKEIFPWEKGELKRTDLVRLKVRKDEPKLSITEKCTFCGICEKVCPTGAIQLNREHGTGEINPALCVDCRLCRDVCYREAVVAR
ncbi:4Fe-4S binding protein [Thermicanus aegyptius]|uniref:4Fe-4S binding protein n=1 Tax=Thermicanus aegyptius TaxID=94009 RepID=UPI000405F74A|nr:4Fe-4S dicluster domain-containing protein [Thermicanus aegyptius]